jgi:hypothetical protein
MLAAIAVTFDEPKSREDLLGKVVVGLFPRDCLEKRSIARVNSDS